MDEFKRITIKCTNGQHGKLRTISRSYSGLTQEDLLGLIIDLTLTNPDTLKPHIHKFLKRKLAEEQRQKDMQAKAANLVSSLPPELQEKLLAGELDLSSLI